MTRSGTADTGELTEERTSFAFTKERADRLEPSARRFSGAIVTRTAQILKFI